MLDLTTKLHALLSALSVDDIAQLAPARRERLGQLLQLWANRCQRLEGRKPAGILSKLEDGERAP